VRIVAAAILFWVATTANAAAQLYIGSSDVPRFGTVEVGGGALWAGGWDLGDRSADLTRNVGTGTGAFTLFRTETEVKPVVGARAHFAFYLSRSLAVEAGIQYARPVVSTRITGDAEGAPDETADETMSRYVFTGSLVYHLTGLSFAGSRGVPFVFGGAGYLRELHEGRELVETGTEYHAGAGLKFWFGTGRSRLGLRGDVGVSIRDGAFDGDTTSRRTLPTAGASLTYLF
jgi:hypothetical protein